MVARVLLAASCASERRDLRLGPPPPTRAHLSPLMAQSWLRVSVGPAYGRLHQPLAVAPQPRSSSKFLGSIQGSERVEAQGWHDHACRHIHARCGRYRLSSRAPRWQKISPTPGLLREVDRHHVRGRRYSDLVASSVGSVRLCASDDRESAIYGV